MNLLRTLLTGTTILSTTMFLTGCGGGASDQPKIAPVAGVVTMDGEPLAGASVQFFSENGRPSAGVTNADGRYELVYIENQKGAVLGNHVVRISTQNDEEDPLGMQGTETVPAKYNSKSTLTATVVEGANEFNFDLQSK